jgi:hypothetical protein
VFTHLESYVLAWFPLVVLALLVGFLRDRTFGKRLAAEPARRVSIGLAAVVFGVYIAALAVAIPFAEPRQALLVGGIWVTITLVFDGMLRLVAPPPQPVVDEDLFSGPSSRSPVGSAPAALDGAGALAARLPPMASVSRVPIAGSPKR